MPRALVVYARVSTGAQNPRRQPDQVREYATAEYTDHGVEEYVDILSGTATSTKNTISSSKTSILV